MNSQINSIIQLSLMFNTLSTKTKLQEFQFEKGSKDHNKK